VVRCQGCDALVSEWAATCPRCGRDVSGAPLVDGADERALSAGEARRRHRWRVPVIIVAALAVGTAAALAAATGTRSPAGPAPDTVLASFPYGSTVGRYVPPGSDQDGRVVVPVTLLDGRRFGLAFPASLGMIGSLGVAIEDEVTLGGANPAVERVIASHATIADVFGSAHPRHSYPGPGGTRVLLFDGPAGSGTSYLVFRFGPWLLSVVDAARPGGPPPLTDRQRVALASDIDASEDSAGFLVLRTRPPVAVAAPNTSGSIVVFGADGTVDDPQVDIEDGYCGRPGSDTAARRWFPAQGGAGVAWCDPATGLHVDATGTYPFVHAVTAGLAVSTLPRLYSPVPRP
jgi:hypothetical protein